jgi:hypothetical protein
VSFLNVGVLVWFARRLHAEANAGVLQSTGDRTER